MKPASVAELLAALSLGIDLAMGQPQEHVLRTSWLAVMLGRAMGLGDTDLRDIYYTTLVRLIGCTGDAHETARLAAGDDLRFHETVAVATMGGPEEVAAVLSVPRTGVTRVGTVPRLAEARRASLASHCEVGGLLARQLRLPDGVCQAVSCGFAAWDGSGVPAVSGDGIPLATRLAVVARDLEIVARTQGVRAAEALARTRRGRIYDPAVVDAFLRDGRTLLEAMDRDGIWERTLQAEPAPRRMAPAGALDELLMAFAFFADLKTPHTSGHSTTVARLSEHAARLLGLPADEADALRRAGLLHDLGRVGVSNGIWDKRGRLTPLEWERVRLHPYVTERILEHCPPLRPLARLAGAHHERLDGSGYHRGSRAPDQTSAQRVLAAADVYCALIEPRPHRPAHSPASAARTIRAEVARGRLDGRAVDAVLAAASGSRRIAAQALITPRELQVLRLLCRGRSNRVMARELSISTKTVGHHVQHIYSKLQVSTRAAATLRAVQLGLLAG